MRSYSQVPRSRIVRTCVHVCASFCMFELVMCGVVTVREEEEKV